MTALIAIGKDGGYIDLPMPNENGYSTKLNDIGKYSRNTVGNLYAYRINRKHTIEVEWNLISPEDKNLIASLTSPVAIQVKYFDTDTSTFKYGKFIRQEDYKITPQIRYDHRGGDFMYYNVRMTLGEY